MFEQDCSSCILIKHNLKLQDEQFIKICAESATSNIVELSLFQNRLTSLSMFILPSWHSLTSINLGHNNIGNKGCLYLSRLILPYLENISVARNNVGSEGVFHLSKAEWIQLRQMALNDNYIGIESIKNLSRAKFPYLNSLQLSFNKINQQQAVYLLIARFKYFNHFDITNNPAVSKAFKSNLQDKFHFLGKLFVDTIDRFNTRRQRQPIRR